MKAILWILAAVLALTGCASEKTETLPPVTLPVLATEAPTQPEPTETEPVETDPPETLPPEQRYMLTFAGDCTFGSQDTTYYAPWGIMKLVGEDYGYPFRNVMDWFGTDEFSMVNLEGVLGDSQNKVPNKLHNLHGPAEFAAILPAGSVEAVTLANNHTGDFGPEGYADTKGLLEEEGVPYVERGGTLLHTTPNGLVLGIYAEDFSDMDMDRLKSSVAALREAGAEIIVYTVHWGKEYSYHPETNQIEWAHEALEAGVDILCGSHPHVLQPYEEYNGRHIFYSLGNFSFGGNMYPRDLDSAIAQVEVIRSPEGEVRLGQAVLIPVSVTSISENGRNNFQPTPYEEGSEDWQRVMDKLAGQWDS